MGRRPRRFKFQKSYKFKSLHSWSQKSACIWEGWIQPTMTIKISWKIFELIRLRFAWSLTTKRKGSRKLQFRKKNKMQKKSELIFGKQPLFKHYIFWYHGFPQLPYTTKVRGARMGKGKGAVKQWYQLVKGGNYFIKIRYLNKFKLIYLIKQLSRCLPGLIKYKIYLCQNEIWSI
jgi:hypothetical protein